jgi:glutathione S-transferase
MAAPAPPVTKPTLIHLQSSCSQSVLWALEELGIDYDVRKFERPTGQAPPELKQTHPQGKSPQLLLPDGRVVTQLSAVLLYLLRTYDTAHRFHREDHDPVREEQLVCIGACDLSAKVGSKLMFHALTLLSPFFVRPLLNHIRNTINRRALDPDVEAALGVLEGEIKGRQWFMEGDEPSRVDFMLHFYVDGAVQPKYVDLKDYPGLQEWMARCEARDAWKRSLEVGNGYDLDFPSRW